MNKGTVSKNTICRLTFNTSFVFDQVMPFRLKELDPNHIRKDNRISPNIQVDLISKPYCKDCNSKTPLENMCKNCRHEC
jgi:hypothetical protein